MTQFNARVLWWFTTALGVVIAMIFSFWLTTHANHALPANQAPIALAPKYADWERRWISPLDPNVCSTDPTETSRFADPNAENSFRVAGGMVQLRLDASTGHIRGTWTLEQVEAPWGWLHLNPPTGFLLRSATTAQIALPIESHTNHLAIALDACARQACQVTLEFEVQTTPAAPSTVWLRAEDILPRLGLNGNNLLRNVKQRQQYGLNDFITLPGHFAAPAVLGVAPVGRWQWHVHIQQSQPMPEHLLTGATDGMLDFSLAWAPALRTDTIPQTSTLTIQHEGLDRNILHTLSDDAIAMQTCVAKRMGAAPDLHTISLAPRASSLQPTRYLGLANHPAAHMAAGSLTLPLPLLNQPTARRVNIAHAMAQRHIADTADLRETQGAQWLVHGLSGAIALLCSAEYDTPSQTQYLLQQMAQQTSSSLDTHAESLGAIAYAAFNGWVRDYTPLAALDVARRLHPPQITALLQELNNGMRVQYALANALGVQRTAMLLSMPLATDLQIAENGQSQGDRWRWQAGGWKRVGSVERHWQWPSSMQALRLDAWPGYERDFNNNLALSAMSTAPAQTLPAQP